MYIYIYMYVYIYIYTQTCSMHVIYIFILCVIFDTRNPDIRNPAGCHDHLHDG